MTTATHAAILSTVSGLSDSQLLEQTGKLAALDHQIQVFVIDHLLEIESRRVYLSRGFSGLFDYVARGLGYSDAAAWRRINAMKLCAHVEGTRERLRDGSLTLDAAAQLQAAFERRDRERARAVRRGGAGAGSAVRPNGSAPSAPALVSPPERKPLPELDVSARKALVDEAAGKSTRGTRPPRSGPAATPFAHPQRPGGCRAYFGAEAISAGDWQLHVAGEDAGTPRSKGPFLGEGAGAVGGHHRFGAEVAARIAPASACGDETAFSAGVRSYFGGRHRATWSGETAGGRSDSGPRSSRIT